MEYQNKPESIVLTFNSQEDVNSVVDNHFILKQLIAERKKITLNASNAKEIDSANLQLLISFILSLNELKIPYEWQSPSSELLQTIKYAGIKTVLGIS